MQAQAPRTTPGRRRPVGAVLLAASIALSATPARSGDFFIDPLPLLEPDVSATLLAPPALLRAQEAPIFVRLTNAGSAVARVRRVEALARWSDGTPAGTIDSAGPLPATLAPRRSAWVRLRWRAPGSVPATDEPIVLSACVAIDEIDANPQNDCDLVPRSRHVRAEIPVIDDSFDPPAPEAGLRSVWDWWTHGTGRHAVNGGVAEFTVTRESHAGEYSDAEINDYRRGYERGFPWKPGVRLELRARASDDNGVSAPGGRGTRGFGFWNLGTGGDGAPNGMTNAWFISVSPETFGGFGLFAATVFDRGRVALFQPLSVDLRRWHDYGIVWTPRGVTFSVDRRPVATTSASPGDALGFVAWIDNYRLSITANGIETSFLDLDRDQTLFVDRVTIWSIGAQPVTRW
ncbi:MAG: family 16 glycosylhydrolase [Deltaproteobacteria bacterium]|nr:family 16 glycosylhydrolase [Deltaproteobacteria bacterium]